MRTLRPFSGPPPPGAMALVLTFGLPLAPADAAGASWPAGRHQRMRGPANRAIRRLFPHSGGNFLCSAAIRTLVDHRLGAFSRLASLRDGSSQSPRRDRFLGVGGTLACPTWG